MLSHQPDHLDHEHSLGPTGASSPDFYGLFIQVGPS